MNEKTQQYLLYGFMVIAVIVAAWAVSGLFIGGEVNSGHSDERYDILMDARAEAGVTDNCAPPPGTSEEEWRTHMSHHPAQYEGCL